MPHLTIEYTANLPHYPEAETLTALNAALCAHPEIQDEVRAAAASRLKQALESAGGEGEARVLDGSPATAIVQTAEDLPAELVVVGTRGRTGLSRLALGSVAERVIRAAGCSVLVVRLRETND